eukprot:scaffold241046_cov16-Tisochrysis_lutea.AAC.1
MPDATFQTPHSTLQCQMRHRRQRELQQMFDTSKPQAQRCLGVPASARWHERVGAWEWTTH